MKTRTAQISLSVICFLVGVMLVTQFRTQTKIQRSVLSEPATNQALLINNLYESNLSLRKELVALSSQIDQYDRSTERSGLTAMADELARMRVVSGEEPVSGQGVEVRIEAPLTREDVQDLINELRNAGAEALALNDRRVVAQTAVVGDQRDMALSGPTSGPTSGQAMRVPFIFRAIGNADTIERALVRKGGVLAIVENAYPAGIFAVSKVDNLILPGLSQEYHWTYAKPAVK